MAEIRIGTSGWIYAHWNGIFYPPKMPGPAHLRFYTDHFSTVEVNYSFYRLPDRTVFESWREQTPPGFVFAVKGSRYLTHMKRLSDPEEPLRRLMDRATGLGDKLGPMLFQLPTGWPADMARLEHFLSALHPYMPQSFAVEFRHASWLTSRTYELLERAGVALCLPVSPTPPLDVRLTADWTYIRMHQPRSDGTSGGGFADDELLQWAVRIRTFLDQGADIYVYFYNDAGGHALRDAQRLREMVEAPS
jgi:uncharacterized protein YecE (DUF72 family)